MAKRSYALHTKRYRIKNLRAIQRCGYQFCGQRNGISQKQFISYMLKPVLADISTDFQLFC
jgi:hypothetical protein